MEADDSAIWHYSGGHDAGGLCGGEKGEPALHDAVQRIHPWKTQVALSEEEIWRLRNESESTWGKAHLPTSVAHVTNQRTISLLLQFNVDNVILITWEN